MPLANIMEYTTRNVFDQEENKEEWGTLEKYEKEQFVGTFDEARGRVNKGLYPKPTAQEEVLWVDRVVLAK